MDCGSVSRGCEYLWVGRNLGLADQVKGTIITPDFTFANACRPEAPVAIVPTEDDGVYPGVLERITFSHRGGQVCPQKRGNAELSEGGRLMEGEAGSTYV